MYLNATCFHYFYGFFFPIVFLAIISFHGGEGLSFTMKMGITLRLKELPLAYLKKGL